MAKRCVLWDFGDTLVDQDWMLVPPDGVPGWTDAWVAVARGTLEDAWNLGEVTSEDVADGVGRLLGLPPADVMNHIWERCSRIRFFDAAMDAVRRCPLPQAIVTVNPDAFSRHVVPHYGLGEIFPVIVTSWEERAVDKAELCTRALDRIDGGFAPAEALLIDNIAENVRAWEARGGRGYVFAGDERFAQDRATLLPELA